MRKWREQREKVKWVEKRTGEAGRGGGEGEGVMGGWSGREGGTEEKKGKV